MGVHYTGWLENIPTDNIYIISLQPLARV